ncbi:MAG TPA: helix-turn-helix transcriptional regulator [Acidimicrobiales bacterium]|nr:helix-turn-helix transcriptional regulator [Acidimicrobiales bacterium]
MTERRHDRYLPGFADMARRRRELAEALVARRLAVGMSQTEVAARMGTSQSAVARLEAGQADVRLSSLERYAAAVDQVIDWQLGGPDEPRPAGRPRNEPPARGDEQPGPGAEA